MVLCVVDHLVGQEEQKIKAEQKRLLREYRLKVLREPSDTYPYSLHFIVLSPPNPAIHTPLPPLPRAETLAADRGRRGTGQNLKTTRLSGRTAITIQEGAFTIQEVAAFQVCTAKGKANFTYLHEHTLDLHQYYHICTHS